MTFEKDAVDFFLEQRKRQEDWAKRVFKIELLLILNNMLTLGLVFSVIFFALQP